MSRIRKIISLVMLFALLVSVLPQVTLALNVSAPTTSVSSSYYFDAMPGVYEMGDGYAVIWGTNFKGTGYIKYTYEGKSYTVYDERNSIVRTGDSIHVVKVPYEHLQGNSYTVYSTAVVNHSYAVTNYGETISAGPITLKAYDGGKEDFDLLVLSDVHDETDWAKRVAAQFTERDPDLVVFNGDVSNELTDKASFKRLFNTMGTVTGGKYPIVYCRGNSETRDVYSTTLLEYFPTKTGEFYYDFRYGPLWGVVIDTGEDKYDSHKDYGMLTNFSEYHQKQEAWLRSLEMDTEAAYRIGIYHMPGLNNLAGATARNSDLTDSIAHLGLQFAVAGYMDRAEVYDKAANKASKIPYDTFICGGSKIDAVTMVTLSTNDQAAYITTKTTTGSNKVTYTTDVLNSDGTGYTAAQVTSRYKNYQIKFSDYVGTLPNLVEEVDRGLNNQFRPTAAAKGTISMVTQPAVFETGGDWYNVVWVTKKNKTEDNTSGITGYVEYTYNGKTYQVYDEVGGVRRSCDNFHTVKVPKKHLNNNTYKVGSFLVQVTNTTGGKTYTTSDWVESQAYIFEDRSGDKAVNLFACSDILALTSDYATKLAWAQKTVQGFGTSPAYILLNGWAVGQTLNADRDVVNFFDAAAKVSGSIHPVVYSRGVTECRGYCAPNLFKYIPTVTGEFYYTLDMGDYTLVNLDTAEDEADSAWVEVSGKTIRKYGDRVHFDQMRVEQLDWINSLPNDKIIAVSSTSLAELDKVFGLGYEVALKNKGAVLSISGHNEGGFMLWEQVDHDSIYAVQPKGHSVDGMDFASILVSGDYAYITEAAYSSKDDVVTFPMQKAVCLSNGKTMSCKSEMPPLTDKTYTVSTPGHLKWISENTTSLGSFSGYTINIVNDIDMQLVPFAPIGGDDNNSSDSDMRTRCFAGIVEGNGHTIKNLNIISTNSNVGLFGSLNQAQVRRVKLSGGMVVGGWFTGGLAGYTRKSIIEECYTDVVVYSGHGNGGGTKAGGLAGFLAFGTVINRCGNYGTIIQTHKAGVAGGIVGQVFDEATSSIQISYNRGAVIAHGANASAGGIFGYVDQATINVINCYNAADVSSTGYQGALVAIFSATAKLKFNNSCFALGYNGANTGISTGNEWKSASGSGTLTGYAQKEMQTSSFAEKFSASNYVSVPARNEGYPLHIKSINCTKHEYAFGTCVNCGVVDGNYKRPDYYLFGFINGANYGCEDDYANMGKYRFSNGKLIVKLEKDSYVGVKTEGNGIWYMTDGWSGNVSSTELYNTGKLTNADKFYIPGNVYLTLTLKENADGSVTLSYAKLRCDHSYVSQGRHEPDCSNSGEEQLYCQNCGISRVKVLGATDQHDYVNGHCADCDAAKLDFYGASLVLEDDLRINFKVSSVLITNNGFEDPYVVFEYGNRKVTVDEYTQADGKYSFPFVDIAPQNMNDQVTATLYASCNGRNHKSETVTYSVAQYCYKLLSKSAVTANTDMRQLLVDLLNYGAAAQKYRNYKTDNLANSKLTEAQKAWGTGTLRSLNTVQNADYKVISNPAAVWKGAGLVLEESVVLRLKLEAASIEGLSVKIRRADVASVTIPSSEFVAADGGYYVYFDGLDANEMSDTLYLTVYRGETAVSNTLSYSIESYAYSKMGVGGALSDLLSAMMKYGDSAKAYAG